MGELLRVVVRADFSTEAQLTIQSDLEPGWRPSVIVRELDRAARQSGIRGIAPLAALASAAAREPNALARLHLEPAEDSEAARLPSSGSFECYEISSHGKFAPCLYLTPLTESILKAFTPTSIR
jgi:hypothetical protein